MFKDIAERLLGEVLIRQLSAHEELHAGQRVAPDTIVVPKTNLRTCFPGKTPSYRIDERGVLRRKITAACLEPAELVISDICVRFVTDLSSRGGQGLKGNC